jgi:hypothetical protein
MSTAWKIVGIAVVVGAGAAIGWPLIQKNRSIVLEGAVILQDADPRKEAPIAGVTVSVDPGEGIAAPETTTTTFSGHFEVRLRRPLLYGDVVTLRFRHAQHEPLDLTVPVAERLYVIRMTSSRQNLQPESPAQPPMVVGDVVVRYTIESRTANNIGSGAKMFEIVNSANIPCDHQSPCSPDGKWKAAIGSVSLDAGEGNEFRNARLSCIAGPCPFTAIDSDAFSKGGRVITAAVRNWSDTATYALEAQVFRSENGNAIERLYPIILGRGLNFTLNAAAAGVSMEAEMDGSPIVFPLAPNGILSWATCEVRVQKDQTRLYRCELKPGYIFKERDNN